jgi:hypothetical protein
VIQNQDNEGDQGPDDDGGSKLQWLEAVGRRHFVLGK